jgi:putative methyltransferase
MNVHIFVPPLAENLIYLPMTWALLKTYYDHRGRYPDRFSWPVPQLDNFDDIENVMQHFRADAPRVFGFGGYVWNIDLCYQVARRIKQEWPDCLVVAGGPQPEYQSNPEWFANHPYIDLVVPRDGEVPFTAILDRVAENKTNWVSVPDLIFPNKFGKGYDQSLVQQELKNFTWPASALLHESKTLSAVAKQAKQQNKQSHLLWETTRGCPYQCTFCDWGGGTYTKVRLKPMDMVLQEIDWIAENEIDLVNLTDANLGMFPRDVELAQYLARMKHNTGWPKNMHINNAKQNADRTIEINKILFDAGLVTEYLLNLQDTDSDVLAHIRRIDLSWEKNIARARALLDHGMPVSLVLITGLPGWNSEKFWKNVNQILDAGLPYPRSYPFSLLPNSPAAQPQYMLEHDIKKVSRPTEIWPMGLRRDLSSDKVRELYLHGVRVDHAKSWTRSDYVISTKWYSTNELFDLWFCNSVIFMGESLGGLSLITKYLVQQTKLSYSDIYQDLVYNFFRNPQIIGGVWQKIIHSMLDHLQNWSENVDCPWEVTPPLDPNFPFTMPNEFYLGFHVWVYQNEFYPRLTEYICSKYDEWFREVCECNQFMLITPEYDPDKEKTQTFSRNWLQPDQAHGSVIITVKDQVYNSTNQLYKGDPIVWHQQPDRDQRILAWFYHVMFGVRQRRWHNDYEISQLDA